MTLLERYRAGERWQVWRELRQLGDRVRDPQWLSQAQAVCDEMALRARHNIEMLVGRLTSQGYAFCSNDDERAPMKGFIPATPAAPALAKWLDEQPFGPIPLTLASWIGLVGDVWLVGTHPDWPEADAADPLVLQIEGSHYPGQSIRGYFVGEYGVWQDWVAGDPDVGGFVLPVAPDRLHKANISGGLPYGFELPDRCADGLFRAETTMSFVAYLNHVFAHGGFPAPDAGHRQLIQELAKDMLPL